MQLSPCSDNPIADTRSPMHIDVIQRREDWAALAEEWNALLAQSHVNTPFLTYEFMAAWWQHKGGGEWSQAELYVLVGRDEDGALVGIAPLFQAVDPQGRSALKFIGSHEIADFLDLIVSPQDHHAFCAALLDHLAGPGDSDWDILDLQNLLEGSATLETLAELAPETPWQVQQSRIQPSPYIPIPDSLDAYIDSLDSKQAHELRRKMRRAARNAVPVEMEIVARPEDLNQALEDFFHLMAQEAEKAAFLTPAMQAQMESISRAAFAAGWLQLVFLKVGRERSAGYMNFDYDNRIWAYNSGFAPQFAALSPGWLLMADMIQWCVEHGREVFDFMRGDEEYKYRFGGIDRFVYRVLLSKSKTILDAAMGP